MLYGMLLHQVPDSDDDLEQQRRRLHEIDRTDWPPLSIQYGLAWEEYFSVQERRLFGRALAAGGRGRLQSRHSVVSESPDVRNFALSGTGGAPGALGRAVSPIAVVTPSRALRPEIVLSPEVSSSLPRLRAHMKVCVFALVGFVQRHR
jgi:hypothetical protein